MLSRLKLLAVALMVFGSIGASAQSTEPQIVIGQTFVGSGPLLGLSQGPLLGIRAQIEAVNEAGGINGSRIKLMQIDDAYDAARAEDNVRQMVKQGAVAILMPIGTTSSIGALKAANELAVPLVGAYSGADPVMAPTPHHFPLRISFAEEAELLVKHVFLSGQTRVGYMYNDNPGAKAVMETTRKLVQARGQELVATVAVAQDGANAEEKAREMVAAKPQAIIMGSTNSNAAKFVKAYRRAGGVAQIYSLSFLNGPQLYSDIGNEAKGIVIVQVVPTPKGLTPLATQYQADMKRIGASDKLSYASFEAYIATRVLMDALRAVSTKPVTAAEVEKALQAMRRHDLGGLRISFDDKARRGLGYSELSILREGGNLLR